MLDGFFRLFVSKPTGWFHVVLNLIGPNNGEGFRIYHDGNMMGRTTEVQGGTYTEGDGRIVIGRRFTGSTENHIYTSVTVEELLFFNKALNDTEITMLRH